MIEGVLEKKINYNYGCVVEEVANYFGDKYKKDILNRANGIKMAIVKYPGVITVGENELYVGEEPICVKDKDETVIIIPATVVCDSYGNVIFVHSLIHALTKENFVRDSKDAFNDVIVDFMAEDICRSMENNKINITMSDFPNYKSNSFYSKMFPLVKDFYFTNKEKIIDSRMGNNISFDEEEINSYVESIQGIVDNVFLTPMDSKEKFLVNRR